MRAVLHGTWITDQHGQADGRFFVWAERDAGRLARRERPRRVGRHPYAATAIEIAELLATHVPETDWRREERATRVALLPSSPYSPIVPSWLRDDDELHDEPTDLAPWRVEGLGVPLLEMLDVLVALPMLEHQVAGVHQRVAADLRFWGLVAKFALELLARQRFLPGMRSDMNAVRAEWRPLLDVAEDQARFDILARGMPPACRAVFRERAKMRASDAPLPRVLVQSFLDQLVDKAVRAWSPPDALQHRPSRAFRASRTVDVATAWRRALVESDDQLRVTSTRQRELTHFYQSWQEWTYQAQPATGSSVRICFRLESPEFDAERGRLASPHWTLRYFLQAVDDPSLLISAQEVWQERGSVLSYLTWRFDQPQEKLLEGLGLAARLCPPIRRSLGKGAPHSTVMSDQEAFTFLRETARLLEGLGFGVLVPPWWNKPDARLRVRARVSVSPEIANAGVLSMDSLVNYDWELALGDEVLTREEFERLAALKTPLVQVRGRWVLLQPDQIEAAVSFWEKQINRGQVPIGEVLKLALGAETDVDGLPLADVTLDEHLSGLVDSLTREDKLVPLDPPEAFVGELRPYQVRGFAWLEFLRHWGFGACLADDMGLGKTIQAIALLLSERSNGNTVMPSLVICPTSLVGNWRREVARFGPSLRVMVHHGSGRAEGSEFVEQSQRHDLVISTYGLARRDIKDLLKINWSDVILDEAQNIKNPVTKQARAVRRLRAQNRVALTGTPIENRLSELWSIMSFLNPGYLGSLESFRRNLALPIERYGDAESADRLRRLVRPFILRRLKTDPHVIQDLPDKFEYKVYCNLSREQATLYEAVVRSAMDQLRLTDGGAPSIKRRGTVLAMLTRLKQICNHPALFLGDGSEIARRSGKLNRLEEMLEEILEVGDRALVFTQFAQMGHLLQRYLQQTFDSEVLFLHGGTPQKQRDRMLTRFQEDAYAPSIFVLSLKAGGTGLNLMRANHVFHYDRWWNPAVENQATDRAYRIGQTRDVQVHKFICLGSLEEKIDTLIESKRALAENIVGQGESWLTELSTDELRDLITLRAEAVETE